MRASSQSVAELVRKEVPDWDDEVVCLARFKAFTGQRSDWENRYLFWRDLILKVARALGVCVISTFEVKNVWFVRNGLSPLCINRVLLEMHTSGDIILKRELIDPTSGRLSQISNFLASVMGLLKRTSPLDEREDCLILKEMLQGRADDIIKHYCESHWYPHCIMTMEKFQSACKVYHEAYAILSHLTQTGKARYFYIRKTDIIEGIKISLSQSSVPSISSLDHDVLHLIWTRERLQQQHEAIEKRLLISRKLAVASLKSGNKESAYRHIRLTKSFAERGKQFNLFLERVEEVLSNILDIETAMKVSEAVKVGARAMKENKISLDEVHQNLQELNENTDSLKEVLNALEATSLQNIDVEDEDLEEEFNRLEQELEYGDTGKQEQLLGEDEAKSKELKRQKSADVISANMSKLSLEAL